MQEQEWLTLREAADVLGISEVSARRWVKSGKLAAAQPGRKYLIPRSAVEELLSPKATASSESGPPRPRLREWLEEHDAKRPLLSDEEIVRNFERLASGSNKQAIPDRFEQEAREAIREETRVLDELQLEWSRGGALLPKPKEPLNQAEGRVQQVMKRESARMGEYHKFGRDIRALYRRYLKALDDFQVELFLEGRTDDFVLVV